VPRNKNIVKTILLAPVILLVAVMIVVVLSVLFGMESYSLVSNHYDRPIASMSYHDHRI
jgi:hypothetical protein